MAGALQEIFELPDQPSLAVGDRRARLVSDVDHVVRAGGRLAFRCSQAGAAAGHLCRRAPDPFVTGWAPKRRTRTQSATNQKDNPP